VKKALKVKLLLRVLKALKVKLHQLPKATKQLKNKIKYTLFDG
jgi:hypothetical protein